MIRGMEFPIVEKLGGREAVAKLLAGKVKPNAVRMWHARGRIPSDAQLVLMEAADRESIRYTATDFRPKAVARISFSIDDEMKVRFEAVAAHLRLDRDQLFREALLEKIEELEDYHAVRGRLDRPHARIDDEQVWRELDLED
jgi:RHH-type transcriptional regulator, rel operon repressor / antitoxin RelB